jgi:hypothetical protein
MQNKTKSITHHTSGNACILCLLNVRILVLVYLRFNKLVHVYFVTGTLSYIPNEGTFGKPGTMSGHPVSRIEDWSAQQVCHPQSPDTPFPQQ